MEQDKRCHLKAIVATLAVLLAINLGATGYLLQGQLSANGTAQVAEQADQATQTKYVLYIGTNDKDTYRQEIPYDTCVQTVTDICAKYTGGCTPSEATGYWKDDSGVITTEQSIQCTLEDVSEDQVHQIAGEILKELNQNSILIETQDVTSEFYAG